MIKFTETLPSDAEQLAEWIAADEHCGKVNPEWWMTGNGAISFCITDGFGPVFFCRFDQEAGLLRMHTQFGPSKEISQKRVAQAIAEAFPAFCEKAKAVGAQGIIFESVSESLVSWMKKTFGFEYKEKDDYVLYFRVN